jgi:hypothetical protein
VALEVAQLEQIGAAGEVLVETRRGQRTYRTVIWVVVDDGEVFVRSVRGESGRWYQRALADPGVALLVGGTRFGFQAHPANDPDSIRRVSEALRLKYAPGRSYDSMVRPEVLGTTLRLDPLD